MHLPKPTSASASRGMSLIEVLCATAVLMVAALGFSRAMVASMHLADATREHTLAAQAARDKLEELQDADFAQLFALYGSGTTPGPDFAVEGLTSVADDEDGLCGEIEFPSTDGKLFEKLARPDLGMPRDLDGSGGLDEDDHALDYALLPVRILVRWRTDGGPSQVEVKSFLAAR